MLDVASRYLVLFHVKFHLVFNALDCLDIVIFISP
jgi:hypothetical protein